MLARTVADHGVVAWAIEAMLAGVASALKPGGRIVVADSLRESRRAATRAEQVKEHEIVDEFVARELVAAGFQLVERRPDVHPFTDPNEKGGFWLIVARKR